MVKLNDNTNETTPLFFSNENRYVGGWKSTLKMAYHVEQTKMNSKRETMTTKQRDVGDATQQTTQKWFSYKISHCTSKNNKLYLLKLFLDDFGRVVPHV
jgi:hypothetical protein